MIKLEHVVLPPPEQMKFIIEGMRNPMNSWEKSDSDIAQVCTEGGKFILANTVNDFGLGDVDRNLMQRLAKAGTDHRKYMRMMPVYVRITAPLYWWKEFDTYKVGTVANSCSTMHKITEKEFGADDFSTEHLVDEKNGWIEDEYKHKWCSSKTHMETTVYLLNAYRYKYLLTKDKKYWWQMIQLLPSSYNQTRNVMLNYEVLVNIYHSRKNHKLDEWREFCQWVEKLPYSELITCMDEPKAYEQDITEYAKEHPQFVYKVNHISNNQRNEKHE